MKKKIFGILVVVVIAVGAMINVNLNKVSNNGDLALANVEALAQSECPQGIWGTNWKSYIVTCTVINNNTNILYVGPFTFGYQTGNSSTATFQGTKCGYGLGTCLSGDC